MARSPFQGSYQTGVRPTVTMSPDALVYINGESDILGCSTCRRRFDWNRYITSIQTDLSTESSPGSASINLSVPRHSIDEFYFEGSPLITPMMEVEIFAKGYFLVEGMPQYYPIFWGLVTEVSEDYSGGEHTFTITCADILKWWEICKMNINPAFTEVTGQGGRSIFGNVFFGMNPYDVIWTLAQQAFGDVIVGTGSLVSLINEKNPNYQSTFRTALGDIMQYWNQRFSKIRSNLLLYGTTGNAVRGDVIQAAYQNGKAQFGKPFASQLVRQANGNEAAQMDFDPTDPSVVAFRTQGTQAGQVNFWQTEYQTKLELATAAKEAIGFEFYMDVTGDIVFKPPFYNLDVLSNKPLSWIQAIDVVDRNRSESEAEVVTQIQIQGNFTGSTDWGLSEETTPYTSVTDYHLLRRYGWRSQTFNSEFLASPQLMFYVGLDMLDRYNSRRHRGTVTIPFRPELRLGFPVYIAPKDEIWYVQGISHSLSYGGRATTNLTLTAKRGKFMAPRGIGTLELTGYKGAKDTTPATALKPTASSLQGLSARQLSAGGRFKADVGEAAQIPAVNVPTSPSQQDPYEPLILRHPKTGRVVGYPNVVMAYTRPFTPTPDELAKLAGRNTGKRVAPSTVKASQKAQQQELTAIDTQSHTFTKDDEIREKHLTNRYSYGINSAGVYTYLHDTSKVVKEMLLVPAGNITFNNDSVSLKKGQTGMIRPVSDERGFEVIGHHRYGRGVSLRDGSLVLAAGDNERANVSVQVALSGDLYSTLQAQSQGLTSVLTTYANPADTIARLQPEDLQTAGTLNPSTKKPEFTDVGTTFVSAAPLYSPQREGGTTPVNVEATQLSRALTLAEMGAREGFLKGSTGDPDCQCLLGRADLAFINVGYQIKLLRPSASTEDLVAKANAEIARAESIAAEDPLVKQSEDPEEALAVATENEINRIAAASSPELGQMILSLAHQGETFTPVDGTAGVIPATGEVLNKVEEYLATLYRALDGPHQEYEKELRGDLIQVQGRTPSSVRFQNADPTTDSLAPPYSVTSRAAGGDPAALALTAKTSINQASKAWSQFGDKLQAGAERTKLQGEIRTDQATVVRLEQEKANIQKTISAGGVVAFDGPGRIKDIDKSIADHNQSISSNQTKIGQLDQEFPP